VTALSHSRACHGFILLGAGLFLLSGTGRMRHLKPREGNPVPGRSCVPPSTSGEEMRAVKSRWGPVPAPLGRQGLDGLLMGVRDRMCSRCPQVQPAEQ
jgi:hypothetical protein